MRRIIAVLSLSLVAVSAFAAEYRVQSPDHAVLAVLACSTDGTLTYRVDYKDESVVLASRLGFTTADKTELTSGFSVRSETRAAADRTWNPPYGERSRVVDAYESLVLACSHGGAGTLSFVLECRAYNAGFAFRYVFPKQTLAKLDVAAESTEFIFAGDHRAWPVYAAQGEYKPARLSEIKNGAERPLTLEIADGPVVALGEAGLFTFARMKFAPLAGKPHALVARLDGPATLTFPDATPWRYVMVADNAARLLEQNDLILINALQRRTLQIPLSFLTPGKTYVAHLYADAAPDGSAPTRVACSTREVTSADTLAADLAENGGHAIRLELKK